MFLGWNNAVYTLYFGSGLSKILGDLVVKMPVPSTVGPVSYSRVGSVSWIMFQTSLGSGSTTQ